jgi:hypothetical protein
MTTLIPNGRAIIFNFPAGAGGKMLQNCVGLSRYCVLNHADALSWQVNYTGKFDQDYYYKKQSWVMATVPPTQANMREWLTYEIDYNQPHGFEFTGFQIQKTPVTNQDYYRAAQQGLWTTVTVHNSGASEHYTDYWPICQQVDLVNNRRFTDRSLSLKLPDQEYDTNWDTRGRTRGPCFEFNMDSSIWHPTTFEAELRRLYDYLGFDDFDHVREAWIGYYAQYINLHL